MLRVTVRWIARPRYPRVFGGRGAQNGDGSCEDALAALSQHPAPQVLLLDVELPGMSGIEGLAHFRQHAPGTALVILTVF